MCVCVCVCVSAFVCACVHVWVCVCLNALKHGVHEFTAVSVDVFRWKTKGNQSTDREREYRGVRTGAEVLSHSDIIKYELTLT